MKCRYLAVALLALLSGCAAKESPISPPRDGPPRLVEGCQAILYDADKSKTTVFAWTADRENFAMPEIGTTVIYLGSIPAKGPGTWTEARVKVLDGEKEGSLLFVPLSKVVPAGPIQDPSAALSP